MAEVGKGSRRRAERDGRRAATTLGGEVAGEQGQAEVSLSPLIERIRWVTGVSSFTPEV